MFLMSPAITLTALFNKQMVLPTFMAPVENWMKAQEALAEQLTNMLLSGDGLMNLLANLLVVAVMAGITEEFFSRRPATDHREMDVEPSYCDLDSSDHIQRFPHAIYGFLPPHIAGGLFRISVYIGAEISGSRYLPDFCQ